MSPLAAPVIVTSDKSFIAPTVLAAFQIAFPVEVSLVKTCSFVAADTADNALIAA